MDRNDAPFHDPLWTDDPEGDWDAGDAENILPWLICFFVCLAIAWIGWLLRHRISSTLLGAKTLPPRRLASNSGYQPPSPPPPQSPPPEVIHWRWVSTGKPPSPKREFRDRTITVVSSFRPRHVSQQSDFRPRHVSHQSDKTWISTTASIDSVKFSIGGFDTPSHCSIERSLSNPSQSLPSQRGCGVQQMSNHKFRVLLSRICSITDPDIKREVFELTFDIIQLGSWKEDEWKFFMQKLFSEHPDGEKFTADLLRDMSERGLQFAEMVRHVLNQWLTWNGIEKADMTEIFAAFESCDKLDIAHNAAVNVVLALRQRQGRSTSNSTSTSRSPFSEAEETPMASLEGYADPFRVADGDQRPSLTYSTSTSTSTSTSRSPFSEAEETPMASLEGYADPFRVADGDQRPSLTCSESNPESLQPKSLTLDQRAPPESRKKRKIQFSQGSLQQPLLLPRYRQYSINSFYDHDASLPETTCGNQRSF